MKSFKTYVRGGVFFCIALLFFSCENFLKGPDVAQEIKDAIAYNNAPSSTLVLNAPEGTGRFLSGTEKSCKLGYTIDIQFTVNSNNYVYTGMQAVSKSNPSLSRSEYIQFTDLSTEEEKQNGTYKVQVKLLKLSDDIMIMPKCLLIPKATGAWPPSDNTSYPQDSSIKVSFNKAIKLSDFADENGFIKNIIIQSGDEDLLDTTGGKIPKYKSPYLIDDDKTLVIPITKGEYLIENQNDTKIINVKINLTGLKDAAEGENVDFSQNDYSFSFKVNSQKDSVKPQFTKLIITRTQQDAANGTNIFQDYDSENPNLTNPNTFAYYATKVNFNNDSNQVAQNIHKHHVNKLWIDFAAEDADSGIAKIVINEKLVYNKNGVKEDGSIYQASYQNESNKNSFTSCFEYDFISDTDGVINLTICLYDYSGNVTEKRIDLIKDTVCLQTAKISGFQSGDIEYFFCDENGYTTCKFTVAPNDVYLVTKDNFIIDLDGNKFRDELYFESETENPIRISKMEYGNSKANLSTLSFDNLKYQIEEYSSNPSNKYKSYKPEITIDATKDLFIILTTEDSIGNTATYETTYPAASNMIFWYEGTTVLGTDPYPAWFMVTDSTNQCELLYIYENPQGVKDTVKSLSTFSGGSRCLYQINSTYLSGLNDGTYYFYARPQSSRILGKPAVFFKNVPKPNNNSITLTEEMIPDFTVSIDEAVLNAKKRHISIKIPANENLNPKLTYMVQYKESNKSSYIMNRNFEFDIPTTYSYYDFRLGIFNENGESIFSAPKENIDLTYDNVPPKLSEETYTRCFSNMWFLKFSCDDGNGAGLETNNKDELKVKYITSPVAIDESSIDWKTSNTIKTGYVDSFYGLKIDYDGGNGKYVYIYIEDKNGNYCTNSVHIKDYIPATLSISKNDNGTINVKNTPIDPETNTAAWNLTDFYLNNGEWTLTNQVMNDNGTPRTSFFDCNVGNVSHKYNLSFTNIENNSYIKIICNNSGSNNYLCYSDYPAYIYPPYYETENFTCKLKSYLECENNEVAIFADKPCLVHTFYCTNNLGNTEDNLIDWLSYATEAKVVQEEESFTYKVPVNDIPTGKYYTTIIHFADGTKHMTRVKQK